MAERDTLVSSLYSELIGPRAGLREILCPPPHAGLQFLTPDDEYIAGVLAPKESAIQPEQDSDFDLLGPADVTADDQNDAGDVVGSPGGGPRTDIGRSPALDPKSRPCSIGVSFLVDSDSAHIDVCATWAWYRQLDTPSNWQREPRFHVWRNIVCNKDRQSQEITEPDGIHKVQIEVRIRKSGNSRRVSIYLLNSSTVGKPRSADYVFQPQIRVRIVEGNLLPLEEVSYLADEDASSLSLLYANRKAFARGHLCAATWNEVGIDPEIPFQGTTNNNPPFYWLDGQQLAPKEQSYFSPADVRTELLPCYLIQSANFDATQRHGASVFDPVQLSELWNPSDIRAGLMPLAKEYADWIANLDLSSLPSQHQATGVRHKTLCEEVNRRIIEGIEKLCSDPLARLAFNFANKAISIQSEWSRKGRVVPWRPFQLAFQLLNICAICDTNSPDLEICDLLWVPTGGGKTESYLGLAAFTFAYRRLRANTVGHIEEAKGTSVISRYTLRLLTIQQFRRAANLVTACESLRVQAVNGLTGWRPSTCDLTDDHIWGRFQFSIGLWVGGNVTPNGMFHFNTSRTERVNQAIEILLGEDGEGDPAQILNCPACHCLLALAPELHAGNTYNVFLTCGIGSAPTLPAAQTISQLKTHRTASGQQVPLFDVVTLQLIPLRNPDYYCISLSFVPSRDTRSFEFDKWCRDWMPSLGTPFRLSSTRPARPGYFFRYQPFQRGGVHPVDFDIYCPNPECQLNSNIVWTESTPAGVTPVPEPFKNANGSDRIPIPALTVDEQVYQRCPTMLIATVDKFARLAFEPRASAIFGLVNNYCERYGYYRAGAAPSKDIPTTLSDHPPGVRHIPVTPFLPPDLVIQDELHLIEGPLGSMVGIYETVIESLCIRQTFLPAKKPKYVASSATVRLATEQVKCLFTRTLVQFPPPGLSVDDNYFSETTEAHQLDSTHAGRLYLGVCAPGRGAQTPTIRIWAELLQRAEELRQSARPEDLDSFWTLVGYFNAIRELAAAVALARQDIPEKMAVISAAPRQLLETEPVELSSRTNSIQLPGLLAMLEESLMKSTPINAVVATSMFGTGVDVNRLGLMVVHGQPKATSSYIQATGRVGRSSPGLVIAFYRAARPRDLSHYEYFLPYHRELYRHVEPVSVNPFSSRARDRALGPIAVALLRQSIQIATVTLQRRWHTQQRYTQRNSAGTQTTVWSCSAHEMAANRTAPEVVILQDLLRDRILQMPSSRQPNVPGVVGELRSEIDRWAQLAILAGTSLLYFESSLNDVPRRTVVLGDLAHEVQGLPVAFENTPNSLREVESTASFRGRV